MKIIEIKVMRGPNFWSINRKKLIVMKLDIEELEELPSNKIDGFNDRIQKLIPSLISHRCSEGKEGGFYIRLKEGTWMGHVIEHIALELQSLAGMECGYGRTRSTGTVGVYHVVFSYMQKPQQLLPYTKTLRDKHQQFQCFLSDHNHIPFQLNFVIQERCVQ